MNQAWHSFAFRDLKKSYNTFMAYMLVKNQCNMHLLSSFIHGDAHMCTENTHCAGGQQRFCVFRPTGQAVTADEYVI